MAHYLFGALALWANWDLGRTRRIHFSQQKFCSFETNISTYSKYHVVSTTVLSLGNEASRSNENSKKSLRQNIYSFGLSEYDIHNINGRGRFRNVRESRYYFSPRKLEANILNDKTIIGLGCTAHSTIVQMNNGALYTWGWPSSGLLGKKDTRIPGISKVEGMNNVRTFYAGECNVFAIVGADDGNLHGLKFRCFIE